jgi:TetR/AcrR family transcriptional regulator, transcriptional repressor of bet genes
LNKREEQKQKTKQKLLKAAIDTISTEGLDGVTISKVTKNASLSRGMCNYHFETKEHLIVEAFEMIYHEHVTTWRRILYDRSRHPVERMKDLITALLTPPIADTNNLAVWLAFWGVLSSRQTYFDLCAKTDREYEDAVENVLREIAGADDPVNGLSLHAIAVSLTGLIDGLGLQFVIAPGQLTPQEAIHSCRAYLSSFFPEFAPLFNDTIDSVSRVNCRKGATQR